MILHKLRRTPVHNGTNDDLNAAAWGLMSLDLSLNKYANPKI